MTTRMYARMILHGWWIILLSVVIAVVAAYVLSSSTAAVYQTSGRYVVAPSGRLTDASEMVDTLYALDRRSIVFTYAEIFNSERIFNATADALGLDAGTRALYSSSTVVLPETNVLEISVEGADPATASQFVDALGQQATDYIRELYPVYAVNVLDSARVPDTPVRPRPSRDMLFAGSLGFVFGIALALLYGYLFLPHESVAALEPEHVEMA